MNKIILFTVINLHIIIKSNSLEGLHILLNTDRITLSLKLNPGIY